MNAETVVVCKNCRYFTYPAHKKDPVCSRPEAVGLIYGNPIRCDACRKKTGPCKPEGKLFEAFR